MINNLYKVELIRQTSKVIVTEAHCYEYSLFEINIPSKRRIITTRLTRVEGPTFIEYRIVGLYRNILFKILDETPNKWRAEKELFYRGFNRTLVRYPKTEETEELRNKRIEEIKRLYKQPRQSEEEFIIRKYE